MGIFRGMEFLKTIFLMIGLPTETEADIEGIIGLLKGQGQ